MFENFEYPVYLHIFLFGYISGKMERDFWERWKGEFLRELLSTRDYYQSVFYRETRFHLLLQGKFTFGKSQDTHIFNYV